MEELKINLQAFITSSSVFDEEIVIDKKALVVIKKVTGFDDALVYEIIKEGETHDGYLDLIGALVQSKLTKAGVKERLYDNKCFNDKFSDKPVITIV